MSGLVVRVGIDVGGTWLRLLAEAREGGRGDLVRVPVPASYDELLGAIGTLVAAAAPSPPEVVVCGLPGTARGGRPVFVPALPYLEGTWLARDLSDRLGAPVRLGVDGQLTLLAEAEEGAAIGCSSAVLVAIGTGVGGAIMVEGRIWQGRHGSAGALGWLPAGVAPASPVHGAFEQVASGAALDRLAAARRPGEAGTELIGAARRGVADALDAVRRYGRDVGIGIAGIASVLDPELVVLAGGLSTAWDVLAPVIRATVARHASPDGRRVPIVPAALGGTAGAVGALLAASRPEWLLC